MRKRERPGRGSALTWIAAAVLAAALLPAAPVSGEESRFGMNRVNLAWASPFARQQILDAMASHGIDLVRLSLTPPFDASLDALRIAHERGMRILLEIPLGNERFYPPHAAKRSGHGRIWDIHRLSEIDPQAFHLAFRDALRRIDAHGIGLLAVQPGNELNIGGYNGDLHVYARGNMRTARSRAELTNRAAFHRGIEKYVTILRIVRDELDNSQINRQAKIISAGISDMSAVHADERGMERIAADEFIGILRAAGIENHIDAFGLHVYPNQGQSSETRRRHLGAILSLCQTPPEGKPCWISEWGIANTSDQCPLNDEHRAHVIREVRELLEGMIRDERLSRAFYFDWDSATPYSVWRCETLTQAGVAAIAPARGSSRSSAR